MSSNQVSWCCHCLDVWPEGQSRAHRVQEDPVTVGTSVPVQFEPRSHTQHEWPGRASSRLCGRACQTLAVSWGTPDSAAPCWLQLCMWPGLGLGAEKHLLLPPAGPCPHALKHVRTAHSSLGRSAFGGPGPREFSLLFLRGHREEEQQSLGSYCL